MKEVVFPGSFDPVTNGHLDLIKRALAIFGAVRVVVLTNQTKSGMFPVQKRVQFLKEALKGMKGVRVDCAQGLLANYMKKNKLTTIVRGLRSAHDWNHERTNAYYNQLFNAKLETVFLPAATQDQYISSSAVKEAVAYGADVADLVPTCVAKAFKNAAK